MAVQVGGKTLVEVCALPIGDVGDWLAPDGPLERCFSPLQLHIAGEVLKELRGRQNGVQRLNRSEVAGEYRRRFCTVGESPGSRSAQEGNK